MNKQKIQEIHRISFVSAHRKKGESSGGVDKSRRWMTTEEASAVGCVDPLRHPRSPKPWRLGFGKRGAVALALILLDDLINNVGHAMSQWIYLGGVKAFADGSLGSRSALFYEPYVDEPDNYGLQVTDHESLLNLTLASDKFGLQIAIHAIGDRANDLILDVHQSVVSRNGARDRRFRIEHAQHLAPGTPGRFGKLGIVASVQPEHLLVDAESVNKKLGIDRAQKGSYLFQSLLGSNVQLAFGSDWPVVDINPLGGIKTAMKRIPPTWDIAWVPSESISLNDALKAYTLSAARACFLDSDLGSLSPGKLADFVILSTYSWDDFVAKGSTSIEATYVVGVQAYLETL